MNKGNIFPNEINAVFAKHTNGQKVMDDLYRLVYYGKGDVPWWDFVKKMHGYPKVSEKTWLYIQEKFVCFDKVHHPDIQPGWQWVNRGFSQADNEDNVGDWEVLPAEVEMMSARETQKLTMAWSLKSD